MALLRQAWMRVIMENLFDENPHVDRAQNWDEYVNAGIKTVTIPQAGTPAGFERNRASLPATIAKRTDSDISFDMTNYTSNPTLVTELEEVQMSYAKMQSVSRNMLMSIKEGVADDILYAWRTENVAKNVTTTGANEPASLPGSTGNRKRIAFADLIKAATIMDNDKIPVNGRILMLPSTMYNTMFMDEDIKDNFNNKLADLNKGILGEILGFTIMKRSVALRYTAAGVAKLPSAATAATDSHAGLAWHPGFVGRSVGNINVYADNAVRPEYYGRVISCEVNAGGKKSYTDGRGVVAIMQDTPE